MPALNREVGSLTYDKLVAGTTPPVKVTAGTIRLLSEAATYARGTVLAKSSADDKLVILGTDAAESSQAFDGTGAATTFTVTAKPLTLNSVKVGGSAVTITSYDATTGKVTLGSAPAEGTGNVVAYYDEEVLTPDCILKDETAVGTAADVVAPVYDQGCFDINSLAMADGYTLTEADKDKLRERGIYLGEVLS